MIGLKGPKRVQRFESINSALKENDSLRLAMLWVWLAVSVLRLALQLAVGSPMASRCRILWLADYKSPKIKLSGKYNCERARMYDGHRTARRR